MNSFGKVENLLKDLDGNKLLPIDKRVHKSITESSKFSLPNKELKMDDMLYSTMEERGKSKTQSYQSKQSTIQQPLKHSEKYFGNISAQLESTEDPSKILTSSSSDSFGDKVLNIINPDIKPDNLFYDEIIGPSTMIPVETKELPTANMHMKPMPLGGSIMDQIRMKDLSIIDEETETDSSSKTDRKGPGLRHDYGSSSDDSSVNNISFEIDHNRVEEVTQTNEDTSDTQDTLSNDDNSNQHIVDRMDDDHSNQHIVDRMDDRRDNMDQADSGSTVADAWNRNISTVDEVRDAENMEYNINDNVTTVTIHDVPSSESLRTTTQHTNEPLNENFQANRKLIEGSLLLDYEKVLHYSEAKETSEINLERREILTNISQENSNSFEIRKSDASKETNDSERRKSIRRTSLVRQEVMDKFDKVLKQLNLNPEWMRLPDSTFEQKMSIIMHERLIKSKTIKSYETKKDAIKRKLETIWREKMEMEMETQGDSETDNVENNERFSNGTQRQHKGYVNNLNINVWVTNKNNVAHDELTTMKEKTKNLNKELENVLGQKREKSKPATEIAIEKKLSPFENSSETAIKKVSFDDIQNDAVQI
ncbi:hypothetical protein WDU94_002619 [Cyamophila willieti]